MKICPNPKIKRQEDKAYLEYIRNQKCLVNDPECLGDITYHHTHGKVFDYLTVPLCVRHHIPGVHTLGTDTFQKWYMIDFQIEIIRLLKAYPKQNKEIKELLKELEGI